MAEPCRGVSSRDDSIAVNVERWNGSLIKTIKRVRRRRRRSSCGSLFFDLWPRPHSAEKKSRFIIYIIILFLAPPLSFQSSTVISINSTGVCYCHYSHLLHIALCLAPLRSSNSNTKGSTSSPVAGATLYINDDGRPFSSPAVSFPVRRLLLFELNERGKKIPLKPYTTQDTTLTAAYIIRTLDGMLAERIVAARSVAQLATTTIHITFLSLAASLSVRSLHTRIQRTYTHTHTSRSHTHSLKAATHTHTHTITRLHTR